MNKVGKISSSLRWKLIEQFSSSISQFVLQILLARILGTELFGVLALMIIVINIANVFIQNGFNISLIQREDLKNEDYSSVFWVMLFLSILIYIIIFITSPIILKFYHIPDMTKPFRILLLVLFPGTLNSIQSAQLWREMDFKKIFFCNISGIIFSGVIGVIVALKGGGVWALVLQVLINSIVACIFMWFIVGWRPKFVFDIKRIKILFSFGWKFLVSGLIESIFSELNGLVIGKKYNTNNLAFYDRGNRFSSFFINAINGSILSVILPAMSSIQNDTEEIKELLKKSIKNSSYIVFPIMFGIAGVSNSLIKICLGNEWMNCTPYIKIFCFSYAFWPIHTLNLYTYNALGRSDIYLKAEIIKKIIGIILLIVSIVFFDNPLAIAFVGIVQIIPSWIINSYPNKIIIKYSFFYQVIDILPSLLLSLVMFIAVCCIEIIGLNPFATIILQIFIGVIIYVALSILFKMDSFYQILTILKNYIKK